VVMVGSWWWWWYLLRFCLVAGRESWMRELNCLISINAKCGAGGEGDPVCWVAREGQVRL
jgi:hypothetical protein